jgi:hypothetical protein
MRALILLVIVECALRHAHQTVLALLGEEALLAVLQQETIVMPNVKLCSASFVETLHLLLEDEPADLMINRTAETRVGGLPKESAACAARPPYAKT